MISNSLDSMNIEESLKIDVNILSEDMYSTKKAVWTCNLHGNYIQSIRSHYLGRTGCKQCLREKRGESKKIKNNKDLMKQLNLEESLKLNPNILDCYNTDRTEAVWVCSKHGNYTQKIQYRLYGYVGCKFCDRENKYGERTEYITDTEVASKIDYEQCNMDGINPFKIIKSSDKKVPFMCKYGHRWYIQARSALKTKAGCPICMRRKDTRPDSIGRMRPDLIKFYSDDNEYNVYEIGVNSLDKVEWICKEGHKFKSEVHTQNYIPYPADNVRCPYCSGLKRQEGINDFATYNKNIMDEWLYELNDKLDLDAHKLPINSNIKAFWKCRNNPEHIWKTTLTSRSKGSGCPYCFKARQISTQEVAIVKTLQKIGLNTLNKQKIDKLEFDVMCDNPKLLIEYHGMAWHDANVSDMDIRKLNVANTYGYNFIIIREVRGVDYTIKLVKDDSINTILYNIGRNYETLPELLRNVIDIINRAYKLELNTNINYSEIIDEAKVFIGIKHI